MPMPVSDTTLNDPSLENVAKDFEHLSTRELKEMMVAQNIISADLEWASRESLMRRIVKHIHTQYALGGWKGKK